MGLIKTGIKAAVAVKVGHMVHDRIQSRKQAEWEAQGNPPGITPPSLFSTAASAPPSTPSDGSDDRLARLAQLGELRASGVLTDAEFEKEKALILASAPR
jgi:Short C-terminal domain